ncbi:MAG: VTT domain-containing protein [Trueperaceae bacterium]|nr:VTT domain-containing protein [Trueperaceae bacterium]
MPLAESRPDRPGPLATRLRLASRLIALVTWSLLLVVFWQGARQADAGPLDYLLGSIEHLADRPWAPAGVFALYLVRPLLLVPITVVNLASGFVLGAAPGLALAMVGTLASASVGYGIGRLLGTVGAAGDLMGRWPLLRALRRRSFESVVAGGLMYLHADAVNLPAGLLRIRFPHFLAGIAVGNTLTMTSAVLAGASVEGGLGEATVAIDGATLWLALGLFAVSLALASWLRRRGAPARVRPAAAVDEGAPPS